MNAKQIFVLITLACCFFGTGGASADVQIVAGQGCPAGYLPVSYIEAVQNQSKYCEILGAWHIAHLEGEATFSGDGYGCNIKEDNSSSLGHTLCQNPADLDIEHDYFTNLLHNPDADHFDLAGWEILENGGDGWRVNAGGFFQTSYHPARRQQVIELAQFDFDAATLDQQKPLIVIQEDFYKTYCPDEYYLKVELLDAQSNVLASWDSGEQTHQGTCAWDSEAETLSYVFSDYPAGVRFVRWEDGGWDTEGWGGHFGTRMDNAVLFLAAPNELSNPDLETGDLSGWTVELNGGSGGLVKPGTGIGGSYALNTSYGQFQRSQLVDLVNGRGYSTLELDAEPDIYVAELFREVFKSDEFFLKVELLDANQQVLAMWDSGTEFTGGDPGYSDDRWHLINHLFSDYGPGLRYIRWTDGGRDTEGWLNHWGARMDQAYLGLRLVRFPLNDRRMEVLGDMTCGHLGEQPCRKNTASQECKFGFFCSTFVDGSSSCHEGLLNEFVTSRGRMACLYPEWESWAPKELDDSRGTKWCDDTNSYLNAWKHDDKCRDQLDMKSDNLNHAQTISRTNNAVEDGRYIYVLRDDGRLIVRPFDRSDSDPSCDTWYRNFRYKENERGTQYLHVRHSQLNDGWDAVYAAGELKVWNGQVVVINNESGHFKPPADFPDRVREILQYVGVPLSSQIEVGDFGSYSASLSDQECQTLLP